MQRPIPIVDREEGPNCGRSEGGWTLKRHQPAAEPASTAWGCRGGRGGSGSWDGAIPWEIHPEVPQSSGWACQQARWIIEFLSNTLVWDNKNQICANVWKGKLFPKQALKMHGLFYEGVFLHVGKKHAQSWGFTTMIYVNMVAIK